MPTRSNDLRKFDVRSLEWYMKHGWLTKEEYERYLNSLPDATDKAVPIEARLEPADKAAGQPARR